MSMTIKQKAKKSMEYSVQEYVALEKALSNTSPDVAEIIDFIIDEFIDCYECYGDEALLDAKIAQQEADLDINNKLQIKTSEIVGIARDNNDLDNAIAELQAAKTQ